MTVDGKTQRGTATAGKPAQHRLGAQLAHDAIVIAQIDMSSPSAATKKDLFDQLDRRRSVNG
jgi:hypothetical protein